MTQQYEDSTEFTCDMESLIKNLEKNLEILRDPRFIHWIRATDENYAQWFRFRVITNRLYALTRDAHDQTVAFHAVAFQKMVTELDHPTGDS